MITQCCVTNKLIVPTGKFKVLSFKQRPLVSLSQVNPFFKTIFAIYIALHNFPCEQRFIFEAPLILSPGYGLLFPSPGARKPAIRQCSVSLFTDARFLLKVRRTRVIKIKTAGN